MTAGPPRPTLPFTEDPDLVDLHDLPRLPPSQNEETDRRARIGDPRNDENLVVAQLHVAFLRAHRLLVRKLNLAPDAADLELKRLYQRIVLDDFLPTVCDPAIVQQVLAQPEGLFYRPNPADPFMPLEFAGAAFRFGHSMVRNAYDYNSEFSGRDSKPIGTLELLFTFTAFSGQNLGVPTLPQNWIIDWSRWVDHADGTPADNVTKQLDTLLADQLLEAAAAPRRHRWRRRQQPGIAQPGSRPAARPADRSGRGPGSASEARSDVRPPDPPAATRHRQRREPGTRRGADRRGLRLADAALVLPAC